MFFGTDERRGFDVTSSRFDGDDAHFDSFSQPLDEIIDARIWAGLHYRTADMQGTGPRYDVATTWRRTTSSRSGTSAAADRVWGPRPRGPPHSSV